MRILIVIPCQPRETGNRVTAERFLAGLTQAGHLARLVETPLEDPAQINRALAEFQPEAGLLLHAYRSGRPWLQADTGPIPFAVLLTGTDLNQDWKQSDRQQLLQKVHQQAGKILTQSRHSFNTLQSDPQLAQKLCLLPAAASLGKEPYDLTAQVPEAAGKTLLLHPAGIRPVKGNLELLLMADRLAAVQLPFHLLFCGPELDPAYAARFQTALRQRPWASWLGSVPQAAMASLLRQCDVILNHSVSEGLSNALVEARVLGRPVLARNIPGNAQLIQHGRNGLLYSSDGEFIAQARLLIEHREVLDGLVGLGNEVPDSREEQAALRAALESLAP